MANCKWFKTGFTKTRSEAHHGHAPGRKPMAAVTAGLLIFTSFAVVGCSKSKESPRTSTSGSSQVTSPETTVASTPAAPATAVSNEKTTPKKTVKKRPATVTYKDVASGVSFQYPRKYVLKTGDDAKLEWNGLGPVPMNFVESGGATIAAVEMPRGSYPGTDFASAFFNVSMHRNLSPETCGKFGLTDAVHPDEPGPATRVKVGEKEFEQVEAFGGEAIKQADAKYYHLYENNTCYEFALGLGTAGYGIEEGIEPVDREQVFKKLEKILATVKLQPLAQKETVVATGETSKDEVTPTVSDQAKQTSGASPAEQTHNLVTGSNSTGQDAGMAKNAPSSDNVQK